MLRHFFFPEIYFVTLLKTNMLNSAEVVTPSATAQSHTEPSLETVEKLSIVFSLRKWFVLNVYLKCEPTCEQIVYIQILFANSH